MICWELRGKFNENLRKSAVAAAIWEKKIRREVQVKGGTNEKTQPLTGRTGFRPLQLLTVEAGQVIRSQHGTINRSQ